MSRAGPQGSQEDIEVSLVALADAANVSVEGKLNVLGLLGPRRPPFKAAASLSSERHSSTPPLPSADLLAETPLLLIGRHLLLHAISIRTGWDESTILPQGKRVAFVSELLLNYSDRGT
jgi:hypothetical protein